jgi:hypothetical protein
MVKGKTSSNCNAIQERQNSFTFDAVFHLIAGFRIPYKKFGYILFIDEGERFDTHSLEDATIEI